MIGAGRIGRIHGVNVSSDPRVELRYIVDPVADATAELAVTTGAKAVSLNEALDDKEVAGVVIASATHTHADLIERIADLGTPIFCEKPLDLSTTRARACVDAVTKHGIPFVLGFNRRYDPEFVRLHALVGDGVLGNVESVHIVSRDPAPPSLDYIRVSGGLFRDMAIHDFDVARWLLGEEPDEVSASGGSLVDPAIGEAGDIDTALIILRTPGGRLCSISNSRRTSYGYDQRVEVHGSLRTARVESHPATHLLVSGDDGKTGAGPFFYERYAESYRMEMRHFVSVIMGNETPRTTVRDGLRALELADAAAQALKEKRTVRVQYVR